MRKALILIGLLAFALPAFAQNDLPLTYKWGFYERVRHEYWANNVDMNSQNSTTGAQAGDRNFFRFKTSVWGQADYEKLASLYVKLTNEVKSYMYYGGAASKKVHPYGDEILFDNLFLDVKKPGDLPVSFRLGRQDFLNQYGEGFLIQDGTPGDGSRTFYFNAAKASWTVDDQNVLDIIYINNPQTEKYLPIWNEKIAGTNVETSDVTAFVADLKNKSVENLLLEPYYIYKKEAAGGSGALLSQPGKIHTVGAFGKYTMDPCTFHAQLADQFGDFGTEDRQALGGYLFADHALKDMALSPVLTLGLVYLSGDDKNTSKNEGWDPLFCRFPIWSEIYGQSYTGESGNSYWTNLQMYRGQVAFTLSKEAKLALTYSFLRANENVAASTTYSFSGDGKNRGQLMQAKLDYTFSKNMSGYLLGEYFLPGNFYTDEADAAIFVRTQLEIKF